MARRCPTRCASTTSPRAGWHVGGWVRAKDGSASIVVTKPFQHAGQVAGIARELSGPQGPLQSVTASHDAAWLGLAHTTRVDGVVDLRDTRSGVTADPTILAILTAQGVNVAALDQQLSAQVHAGLSVRVVADLPGGSHTVTAAPGNRTRRRRVVDRAGHPPGRAPRRRVGAARPRRARLAARRWRPAHPPGPSGRPGRRPARPASPPLSPPPPARRRTRPGTR